MMTFSPTASAQARTRRLARRACQLLLASLTLLTAGAVQAQRSATPEGAAPGAQERVAALMEISARMRAILERAGLDLSQPANADFSRLSVADQAELQALRERLLRVTGTAGSTVAQPGAATDLALTPTAGTSWAVPAFPAMPLPASNAAWLDEVAGPRSASPGLASFGELRFEGEVRDGQPAGRGVLRSADGKSIYEGRLQGVTEGGKTKTWIFTSPALRTWVPPATGRYGAQEVVMTRGARGTVVATLPTPDALREAAARPLTCARPAVVPAHWVAWQMRCADGMAEGNMLFFSPDLRHSFFAVARQGRLVGGTLRVDHSNQVWDATEWRDGLQPAGSGRLSQREPAEGGSPRDLRDAPLRPVELVFEGRFVDGRPEGTGLCGAQRDTCTVGGGSPLRVSAPWMRPSRPEWDRIDTWVRQFDQPGWKADDEIELDHEGTRTSMLGRWGSILSLSDCQREGTLRFTVEGGGQLAGGVKAYRGDWSRCGPLGVGELRYANGDRYIGEVGNAGRPAQPVPRLKGLGLIVTAAGEQRLVTQDERGQRRNLVRLDPVHRWWAQGNFDNLWNASDGEYALPDGSRYRGRLEDARPAGTGLWRNASNTVRIRGEGRLRDGELVFTGALEVSFDVAVGGPLHPRRGPGRYLGLASEPTTAAQVLARLDRLVPTRETLASQPAAECLGELTLPPGWRADGGLCAVAGWGATLLIAYSPDQRWRLVSRFPSATPASALALPTAWDRLEELSPDSPHVTQRSWRAASFDTRQWPVVMSGEVRHSDMTRGLDYTGPVHPTTLQPDGDGRCARPRAEGGGDEPCQFAAGRRVDELHRLREERLALERQQREAAARVAEQRRRSEEAARQREQEARAAREAAQERAEQARRRAEQEEDDRDSRNAIISALGSVQQTFQQANRDLQASARRNQAVMDQANEAARRQREQAEREQEERRSREQAEQRRSEQLALANAERQRNAADAEAQRRLQELQRRQDEARARQEQQARQQADERARRQEEERARQAQQLAQAGARAAEPNGRSAGAGAGAGSACFELFNARVAAELKYDRCVSDRRRAEGSAETVKSLRENERQCMEQHRPAIDAARQRERDADCGGSAKPSGVSRQ